MGRLVLDRKQKQSVNIGAAVVTVVSVSGNRVKLAVEADESVRIVRSELEWGRDVEATD